jgi:hypothetical protein
VSDISDLTIKVAGTSVTIDEAVADTTNAAWEAEAASALAEALGSEAVANGLNQVKEQLEALVGVLISASNQASTIQALAIAVGSGSPGSAPPATVPQASSDPAAVNGPRLSGSTVTVKRPGSSLRKRLARVAEKAEDIADAADQFHEGITSLNTGHVSPPQPPTVTATSTQAAQPPLHVTGAPDSGIEAGNIASAGLALTVGAVGAATMFKRAIRRRGHEDPANETK